MQFNVDWKLLLPGILLIISLTWFYYFKIHSSPELERRYMITYCRYLCKKAIVEGKLKDGIVLSEIYRTVSVPVSSTELGNITRYENITWKWDYKCCVGNCSGDKKIVLDENCTLIGVYG